MAMGRDWETARNIEDVVDSQPDDSAYVGQCVLCCGSIYLGEGYWEMYRGYAVGKTGSESEFQKADEIPEFLCADCMERIRKGEIIEKLLECEV